VPQKPRTGPFEENPVLISHYCKLPWISGIYHTLPKTRLPGIYFCCWQYQSSCSEFDTVGSKVRKVCHKCAI